MEIVLKRPPKESKEGSTQDYSPWDESKYRVKVESAEEVSDQYGGFTLDVRAIGGDYEGQTRRFRIFPNSEAIRTLVDVTGGDSEEETATLDLDSLVGMEVNVYISHREKAGKTYMNIKKFGTARKSK